MKLDGKTAIVTGASKGLGAAIATGLAREGAAVIVNYARSAEAAQAVVARIIEAGGKALAVQADVSKADQVRAMVAAAIETFGGLDILVNNSGVYEYGGLDDFTEDAFRRIFDTDVLGVLPCSRESVARMRDGGSIINIGSLASRLNGPGTLIYAAAKNAVDGVTKVLSQELGPRRIRVNSVNPGLIETEGTRDAGFFGGGDGGYASTASLGAYGQPADVADIVTFLAGDDARWVTGEVIFAIGPQPAEGDKN